MSKWSWQEKREGDQILARYNVLMQNYVFVVSTAKQYQRIVVWSAFDLNATEGNIGLVKSSKTLWRKQECVRIASHMQYGDLTNQYYLRFSEQSRMVRLRTEIKLLKSVKVKKVYSTLEQSPTKTPE